KLTHGLETTLKYLQDTKKTRQELLGYEPKGLYKAVNAIYNINYNY
ncbi:hypothetical protein L917_21459, partial [Phytophthora nicotianae]